MLKFWTITVSLLTSLGIVVGFVLWLTSINAAAQSATRAVARVESSLVNDLAEIKLLLWEQNQRLSRIEGQLTK